MIDRQTASRLPPYVFAEVNRMKDEARAAGRDIIDFGMGNPDLPPEDFIIDKLAETARDPKAHRYSASSGIKGLKKAQARYYARRFGVDLDPATEVVATLGSKEGFATLASAITRPGDAVLVPTPSYPIHVFGFVLAGGLVKTMPSTPDENLFRAAEAAMTSEGGRPVAMVLNYPGNPTAEVATRAFYEEAVAFARKHDIILISDLAYAEIFFGDEPPMSILEIDGARDVAVEFTSMSKTFSMPGWRMGFCVGNAKVLAALSRMKSYLDYGSFTPIQVAAVAALDESERCASRLRSVYKKRRDCLVEAFGRAGFPVPTPDASMFAWAPVPDWFEGGSLDFAKTLLEEADVVVSPGIGFGEAGDRAVRIALVENEHRTRQAARQIGAWLARTGRGPRLAQAS
ncbi:MAG: aminotransferase class I/II-fold pyridoxal phosphate-dependent enzyme [Pseudomonadota bacterium]